MYGDYKDKKYFRERAAKGGVENIPWVKQAINSTLFLQDPKKRAKLEKYLAIKSSIMSRKIIRFFRLHLSS